MTYLLDVNVWVALLDSAHVCHDAAHRWFSATGFNSFATCPIVENGLIRVLSNPAYPTVAASPVDVAEHLRLACSQPGHVFWADDVSLLDRTLCDYSKLIGHQQITDLYLAALAHRHGGKLATFDRAIPVAAVVGAITDVAEVIRSP